MLRACLAVLAVAGVPPLAPAAPPVSPDPKTLAVPPEDLSKARTLVQKLGDEEFRAREDAERELAAMGRLARAALLDGVNTAPDPEIRQRCRTLLPRATAAEMKVRLETFLADTDGRFEHDLPGWHQLRAAVRGEWKMFGWTFTARPNADKAARVLFTDFLQAPGGPQLLAALDGPPETLGQLVGTRKQELCGPRGRFGAGVPVRNATVAEVGVVLFAESQVHSRHVSGAASVTAAVSTSGLQSAVQGADDRAQALRAVMTAWFDSRTEPTELYAAFHLATAMGNAGDAVGRLATRLMTTPGVPGGYKGQALMTLVRLKMTDQVPAVERAFADTTVLINTAQFVNGQQVRKTIEVRDAALAAALVMTGQDPNDYGFDAFPKNVAAGGAFSYVWAKIPDEKRKDAFDKWAKWREKNP
jgi:hypothetical protein